VVTSALKIRCEPGQKGTDEASEQWYSTTP
jgi:hypothetical protein